MESVQYVAIQNVFGKMKANRICKGIEHMNKNDYTKNLKIIVKMCKKWSNKP